MSLYIAGQRWISESELELGLGTIVAGRRRGACRSSSKRRARRALIALEGAPAENACAFRAGDKIKTQGGEEFIVREVREQKRFADLHR